MGSEIPDTQASFGIVYTQDMLELNWGTLYALKSRFKSLAMTKNEYSIGRLDTCDVVLGNEKYWSSMKKTARHEIERSEKIYVEIPAEQVMTFSKLHFTIKKKNASVVVLEDHSSNGTYVNGILVGKGNKVVLQSSDQISLAHKNYKVFVFEAVSVNESLQLNYPPEVKNNFVVSSSLGKGSCGEVFLVFNKRTLESFAMKVIEKKSLNSSEGTRMNEVTILKALKHPCVVSIHNVVNSPSKMYIFLEFVEGGDLFTRVNNKGKLCEKETKWIFYQITKAVEYLHNKGIAHRDLKLENILLSNEQEYPGVKITDFGLSRCFSSQLAMKTVCGTLHYVAPEVLETKGRGAYSNQIDVWSLGVSLYICLSGCMPFSNEKENMSLVEQICSGSYFFPASKWKAVSENAIELIKKMMTVNPKIRIVVNKVLAQPWFEDKDLMRKLEKFSPVLTQVDENEPPYKKNKP